MFKTIYLVRHCKAEGQSSDVPLTALGFQQAKMLAEFFQDKQIDLIISSPFTRAIQSIEPLANSSDLQIKEDERLSERVLSSEDCENWMEMLEDSFHDLDICYEGGESSRIAMNRATQVIEDVLIDSASNILIVTHGNLMSLMLKHYDQSFGFEEWKALSNPDVYCLKFDGAAPQISRIWA
ncbi:histidine phosphatase family protein [Bacillus sp. FJAT-49736]|uniref:histidine phosphatase family protein n=1 Tax=Bacillus sp. FJAT-49736 TaxID=2833582 RepID=UPI001BC9FAE2|nr:histidine phosphatase family protein [Bacillus sp. FJAT-49736]MBS4175099.1 histidine phosphatase family protein [Bacillus sp. FJAT-49736]